MLTAILLLLLAGAAGLVLWPRHGLLARWTTARGLAQRARREDALKHIVKAEANDRTATVVSVAGALKVSEDRAAAVLGELEHGGLLAFERGAPRLTEAGRELGRHVVRAHRLWESFLADQTGHGETDWHRQAEIQEHLLTPEAANALAARLGHPLRDPHGDAIPTDDEQVPADSGQLLTDVRVGEAIEVVHLEDEPDLIYKQLLALGLRPGTHATVVARPREAVELEIEGGRRLTLTSLQANNVAVHGRPGVAPGVAAPTATLAQLSAGEAGQVTGLSPACRGAARRRLLDLGFVPGTTVVVEFTSPNGDPTAYRVRGSVIALRREQASLIRIAATVAGAREAVA